ncbi:MAG: transglutaminase family protein [Sphingomonas sp.]
MRYDVSHSTRFRYARPVRFSRCNLRLRPIDWDGQTVENHAIRVDPPTPLGKTRDNGYAVNVDRLLIDRPAAEVVIESRFRVTVARPVPEVLADDPSVAEVGAAARASRDLSATGPANYLYASPLIALDADIAEWCAVDLPPSRGIVEACLALTRRIFTEFRYDGKATEADTLPAEAFAKRHGVCQDFAQVMIAGLRANGVPAAYVSGYLRTIPPPGKPRLVGADATHAWVVAWCGEARGWIGFDPTNACMMAGDHIVSAIGRDYADVAPIGGIFLGGGRQRIDVSVDVAPID